MCRDSQYMIWQSCCGQGTCYTSYNSGDMAPVSMILTAAHVHPCATRSQPPSYGVYIACTVYQIPYGLYHASAIFGLLRPYPWHAAPGKSFPKSGDLYRHQNTRPLIIRTPRTRTRRPPPPQFTEAAIYGPYDHTNSKPALCQP